MGIQLNERADELAKNASKQPHVDIESFTSMKMIKSEMRKKRDQWVQIKLNEVVEHSESLQHYLYVLQNSNVTYGKNSSYVDTVIMRMRLGYKHYWQVIGRDGECCHLCQESNTHTLAHYILECEHIRPYRNNSLTSVKEQVCWMLNNNVKKILKRYKNFAPRL